MTTDIAAQYLDEAHRQMRGHKRLAESAMAQLKDHELFLTLDPESNSIAVIVQHMAGNMRSRFTDFLTTDGEKPERNRDREFELDSSITRADQPRYEADYTVEHWHEDGKAHAEHPRERRSALACQGADESDEQEKWCEN